MRGGDSYYVLVNKNDEAYEIDDYTGCETLKFGSWEEAEEVLKEYLEDEMLDESEEWHIERWRW